MTKLVRDTAPLVLLNLETHTLTGWPRKGTCACGAAAALIAATRSSALYECRGADHPGRTFEVEAGE